MILLFSSVGLWRQQLRPDARVHGIIQEGGTAANIIPDRTRAWFMLRSPDQAYYEEMKARFRALADGAALATGTTGRGDVLRRGDDDEARTGRSRRAGSRTRRPTGSRTRARTRTPAAPTWATSAGSARRSTRSSRSATRASPGHSIAFRDAAATPRADEVTLLAATLVAQVAVRAVRRPGARRGRLGASSAAEAEGRARRRTALIGRGASIRAGAPRWTSDANRRRPSETATAMPAGPRAGRAAAAEDLVAERPDDAHAPGSRRRRPHADPDAPTSPRPTAGTASTRPSATSSCRPTSARRRS